MLKQLLKNDLKDSMLARDEARTSTLRMLLSAIGYMETQKGGAGYEATDEDVLTVINREVKQRNDAIEQFMVAGREELAAKELKEKAILETYLPEQMSEGELEALVDAAVKEVDGTSQKDMGKVMSALMPRVKGKADGALVSRMVKERLSS